MKKILIIPAYNEGKSILNLIKELQQNAPDFDYIIVNDCSTDDTEEVCISNNLNYVSLSKNLGIGGAVQTGYKYALEKNYDVAVQVDGDGQHDTKYLYDLLEEINNGFDMAIGSRFIEQKGFQSSFMRRIGKNLIGLWIRFLFGFKITDPTSGYRMCNKRVIEIFANNYPIEYPEPETSARLIKNNYKIKEVPVIMKEREFGKSSITPIKSVKYMIKVLFSIWLVRFEKRL